MSDRPILLNGEMVRAVLDGRKTQTRRVVKGVDGNNWISIPGTPYGCNIADTEKSLACCPYGVPGDRLRMRLDVLGLPPIYFGDADVTEVRVERVSSLSHGDARAEGINDVPGVDPVVTFASLWDSINAKRGFPWTSDCWVWVVGFRRVSF